MPFADAKTSEISGMCASVSWHGNGDYNREWTICRMYFLLENGGLSVAMEAYRVVDGTGSVSWGKLNLSQEFSSLAIFKYGPATTPCSTSNLIFLNPLVYFSFVVYAVEGNLFLGDTRQKPIFECFQMELCKLLPWQATRWLFTHFLCFRGGNRHRKWRWNHLKPGMNLRCWHLIRQNESWVDKFYLWRSPDSNLCDFQCSTNCWNLLNKMNGFLLVLNIEFCTLVDVLVCSKIF